MLMTNKYKNRNFIVFLNNKAVDAAADEEKALDLAANLAASLGGWTKTCHFLWEKHTSTENNWLWVYRPGCSKSAT